MEKTDAISIVSFVKDITLRLRFDSEKLSDQCYGSCATMIGKMKRATNEKK